MAHFFIDIYNGTKIESAANKYRFVWKKEGVLIMTTDKIVAVLLALLLLCLVALRIILESL